jgi:hypothetical protein
LKIPLFRCKWIDLKHGYKKEDKTGFVKVDFARLAYLNDPFILASKAAQVFYVDDPKPSKRTWMIAVHSNKRMFDGPDDSDIYDETPPISSGMTQRQENISDDNITFVLNDGNDELYF